MGKEWEMEDESYGWKDSLGPMLVEQTFPKLLESDVEARAVYRTKGRVGS